MSSNWHDRLAASWWRTPSVLTFLLTPLSLIYGLLMSLRRILYRIKLLKSFKPSVPVILVGNFTVGGTGKTPVVIALVKALQLAGYIPGIVSKGYRRENTRNQEVTIDSMPADVGDEPLLLHLATGAPVVVAHARAEAARMLQGKVNVIISDDGLQHLALAREIEWAVTDSRREGNGWLLPAGPLREPVRAVNAVLVTSGTVREGEWALTHALGNAYAAQDRQHAKPLPDFATQRCAAVAGIGAPERFFEALRQRGVKLASTLALTDHFDYTSNPFEAIKAEVIFITEKDAIKCAQMDPRLWVVPLIATLPDGLIAQTLHELKSLIK